MIEVFGGTGFIGSEFCKKYQSECHIVPRESLEVPQDSAILYLISTVDNYNVLDNPFIDIETNLIHLMKVLNANKNKNVTFHFVSSWFVYGSVRLPATETSKCKPKGFYSITKLAAEQLIESYCKTFKINYTIIRLANVVGKSDGKVSKKKNALQFLIEEMREHRDIKLYHSGKFYRDFIHVQDVIDGLRFIIDNGISGEIYNLGSTAKPTAFIDVINYVHEKLNSKSKIGSMKPTEFHNIVQVKDMYLECSKLTNLGFTPSKTVYDTIDTLI
jgi:nucleoside-diphosphate-sugar epimerase